MIKQGETTMQLVLNYHRITVSITMFDGVLVTRLFEGNRCYDQLLSFLKTQFDTTSAIHSLIFIATDNEEDSRKA
jgi:hypothetical protein